jgi:glycopeptide antibiotics resistance protein
MLFDLEGAMQNQAEYTTFRSPTSSWSNRILIAAVAGILFLTLFPFRFDFATRLPSNAAPLLLGRSAKVGGPLNVFLNILLFVPFGFGLSETLHERGKSWKLTFILTLLAGALFSYIIEYMQFFIPSRDSGWEDVFTNSAGAVTGFILFKRWGRGAVCFLSDRDSRLTKWLTFQRAVMIIPIYFAAWLAISIPLQEQSLPSNWDPSSFLVVGNNMEAEYPWLGRVFRLQLWDRALPEQLGRDLTGGGKVEGPQDGLVGDFEFSGPSPLQDRQKLLPELVWTPSVPASTDSNALVLDGKAWVISTLPVSDFVRNVQRTNQFAVRVVGILGEVGEGDKRIVSISNSSGIVNMILRQEDTNLVFWFRNPLSVKRSLLAWYVPKVFNTVQPRDILFSYDGSNLSLFIDGRKEPRPYQLGPGTRLAQLLVQVTPAELDGYRYIYEALVFLPAGILTGLATRSGWPQPVASAVFLAIGVCLPLGILEWVLVSVSGRALSRANLFLSALLTIAGILWINLDRRARYCGVSSMKSNEIA